MRRNVTDRVLGNTKDLVKRTVLKDGTLSPRVPTLRRFGEMIRKRIVTDGHDLLLVIKGTVILPETLTRIKRSSPGTSIILWQQDSMVRYPLVLKGAKFYDAVYVAEPSSVMGRDEVFVARTAFFDTYGSMLL